MTPEFTFIYDGECPFCNHFAGLIELKSKINNLPILKNDTDKIIEFNNSIEEGINQEKNRNFWNLLKIK